MLTYYYLKQTNSTAKFYDVYDYIVNKVEEVEKAKKEILLEKMLFKENVVDELSTRRITIDDIDLMSGLEFEGFVNELFNKMGYKTKLTKASGDQGIDIIAERDGIKIGIQAKCYSQSVGNSAIQEAVAGKAYYNCEKIAVVTNSHFTKGAVSLARANNVILWDRKMLIEKLGYF